MDPAFSAERQVHPAFPFCGLGYGKHSGFLHPEVACHRSFFRDPGEIAKSYPAKIGSRAAAGRPFPGKVNAQIAASRFYCGVLRAILEESPGGGPRTVAVGRGAARTFGFNSCRKMLPKYCLFLLIFGFWVKILGISSISREKSKGNPRIFHPKSENE